MHSYTRMFIQAVHSDITTVNSTIASTTTDVLALPTPIEEDDGNILLSAAEQFESIIIDILNDFINKEAILAGLPGGVVSLIERDLISLWDTIKALEAALIGISPVSLINLLRGRN